MATYSVLAHDGQMYGPADEVALADWVREGRVSRETMLHCHETNTRLSAAAVPALQPVLGLSPQQVNQLLQPLPPGAGYAPLGYVSPGAMGPAEHGLSEFPTVAAVLLSIFAPLFALIYYGIAHGNLPKRRPDDPGAGKAIGFMFIPFFNLYWVCFFWVRLCTRINDERVRVGLPPTAPRGLVIAILWCYLGLFVPLLNILAVLAILVMMLIALIQIQGSINNLVAATSYTRA